MGELGHWSLMTGSPGLMRAGGKRQGLNRVWLSTREIPRDRTRVCADLKEVHSIPGTTAWCQERVCVTQSGSQGETDDTH